MGVLLLGGTTASGKSDLAVRLALRHEAVIVSADAMTVYRGLSVGTAKPTMAERKGVPHFGIDVLEPNQVFDVAEFVALVDEVIEQHSNVIIVGGTTFWLSALVRPLADLPPSDPEVRADLEALADPHNTLAGIDPCAAERLHPNDRVRIVRALEVHALTGRTQTELHRDGPRRQPIDATVAWMDRADVYERINQRVEKMAKSGYLEETRAVLDGGFSPTIRPLRSFAYCSIVQHLGGEMDLQEALRRTARDTRHYAKKQRTWARNLGWGEASEEQIKELCNGVFGRPNVPGLPR